MKRPWTQSDSFIIFLLILAIVLEVITLVPHSIRLQPEDVVMQDRAQYGLYDDYVLKFKGQKYVIGWETMKWVSRNYVDPHKPIPFNEEKHEK